MLHHNPTSSSLAGNDSSNLGSQWNNKVTRRLFLKRTGAATAATVVAWNLSPRSARAEEPATGDSAPIWKKMIWGCKRTIAGGQNTPFTQAQLDALALAYEANDPWGTVPQAKPVADLYDPEGNDPQIVIWDGSPLPLWITHKYRGPKFPKLQNWIDPVDGKYYAAYLYDYVWERTLHTD